MKQWSTLLSRLKCLQLQVESKFADDDSEREFDPLAKRCGIARERGSGRVSQPKLLKGVLKEYQLQGLQWMVDMYRINRNCLLADDMGLGKTIQAIALMAHLAEHQGIRRHHLVVCPKSVCRNWVRELTTFFPSARVTLLPGTHEEYERVYAQVIKPRNFDILITTYGCIRSHYSGLQRIKWEIIVTDEAHQVKNHQSQVANVLRMLRSRVRLMLTGTPMHNKIIELWSLLNYLEPQIFGDSELILSIEEKINEAGTREQKIIMEQEFAQKFQHIVAPFIKRRTKAEIALGLPSKTQYTLFVSLTPMQLQLYKEVIRSGRVAAGQSTEGKTMKFRKICLHPYLFPQVERGQGELDSMIRASGKMMIFDKLLTKLIKEEHKVVVFSQFTSMLDLLGQYLQLKHYDYCRLDGSMEQCLRIENIDRFNGDREVKVFLLSTRAGGLGINLTAADRVIIYDIDWNPQNDFQAADRAYRIGQTKEVQVYKLITDYTVEERMLEVQKYKLVLDQLLIQKGFLYSMLKNRSEKLSLNSIAMIGVGQILRIEGEASEQTLDEAMRRGKAKDSQKMKEMKSSLQQYSLQQRDNAFNPFAEQIKNQESVTCDIRGEEEALEEGREYRKFLHAFQMPEHKFFRQRELYTTMQYRLYLESKRRNDRDQERIERIREEIMEIQKKEEFRDWSLGEVNALINGLVRVEKSNYQKLEKIVQTKTKEEIKKYLVYFFENAANTSMEEYLRRAIYNTNKYKNNEREEMEKNKAEKQRRVRQEKEIMKQTTAIIKNMVNEVVKNIKEYQQEKIRRQKQIMKQAQKEEKRKAKAQRLKEEKNKKKEEKLRAKSLQKQEKFKQQQQLKQAQRQKQLWFEQQQKRNHALVKKSQREQRLKEKQTQKKETLFRKKYRIKQEIQQKQKQQLIAFQLKLKQKQFQQASSSNSKSTQKPIINVIPLQNSDSQTANEKVFDSKFSKAVTENMLYKSAIRRDRLIP